MQAKVPWAGRLPCNRLNLGSPLTTAAQQLPPLLLPLLPPLLPASMTEGMHCRLHKCP